MKWAEMADLEMRGVRYVHSLRSTGAFDESSGLQVCFDCFGCDLLSFWVQARRFLSRWFCALLVRGQLLNLLCI